MKINLKEHLAACDRANYASFTLLQDALYRLIGSLRCQSGNKICENTQNFIDKANEVLKYSIWDNGIIDIEVPGEHKQNN